MPKRSEQIDRRPPLLIGWREPVALPEWGIDSIKCKVDTGARTSAIHVDNIEEIGDGRVRFDVVVRAARERSQHQTVSVETSIVRIARVRPSTGTAQRRFVVRTRMRLGPIERDIEISLVSRHGMLYRLLLGRSALDPGVLVDPGTPSRFRPSKVKPAGRAQA